MLCTHAKSARPSPSGAQGLDRMMLGLTFGSCGWPGSSWGQRMDWTWRSQMFMWKTQRLCWLIGPQLLILSWPRWQLLRPCLVRAGKTTQVPIWIPMDGWRIYQGHSLHESQHADRMTCLYPSLLLGCCRELPLEGVCTQPVVQPILKYIPNVRLTYMPSSKEYRRLPWHLFRETNKKNCSNQVVYALGRCPSGSQKGPQHSIHIPTVVDHLPLRLQTTQQKCWGILCKRHSWTQWLDINGVQRYPGPLWGY